MKEMNSLETQLRSWRPRRPSAGLERRLFATPVSRMPKMAWFVGWLVPATACALLTFLVFNSGNAIPGRSSVTEPDGCHDVEQPKFPGAGAGKPLERAKRAVLCHF